MSLAEMYAERCAAPSDIFLHLPRFVDLVEETNAQYVVELGSRTGVSTVAWLHALNMTGGRLTTVDLDEPPAIGSWPHWTHIRGDDCDPEIIWLVEDDGPADIVFIDTSHHYRHTCRELDVYRPLVRPGGFLVLHDTELAMPEGADPKDGVFPVKRAVREFAAASGLDVEWVSECWGLAIIRVE